MVAIRKKFSIISIFVPEEDFALPDAVNSLAKKDDRIDKNNTKSKKNLISFVTRMLWKSYVNKRRNEIATANIDSEKEDESSNQESDNTPVQK